MPLFLDPNPRSPTTAAKASNAKNGGAGAAGALEENDHFSGIALTAVTFAPSTTTTGRPLIAPSAFAVQACTRDV